MTGGVVGERVPGNNPTCMRSVPGSTYMRSRFALICQSKDRRLLTGYRSDSLRRKAFICKIIHCGWIRGEVMSALGILILLPAVFAFFWLLWRASVYFTSVQGPASGRLRYADRSSEL